MGTAEYPIWHPFTQEKTAPLPAEVRSAKGASLFLEDGREIIDCISSWWATLHGHTQPEIAEAIYNQAQELEHVIFAGYTHQPAKTLAEKLLQILPDNLAKVFFSDNGSTAVEVALKQAYQYWRNQGETDRRSFLCFKGSYHGDTIGAMSLGERGIFNRIFEGLMFEAEFCPYPSTYLNDIEAEKKESEALAYIEEKLDSAPSRYAAIVIEPLVQGAGGMNICRAGFLKKLEELAQAAGTLVIYDEVMTGFGRTGSLFACIKAGTHPDIICLSKGLTGGFLPMAVTVSTKKIYQAFYHEDKTKAFLHGHTYTGNPLGCAAALASLSLLQQNPSAYTRFEEAHKKFFHSLLEGHLLIEKPRFCGTIFAFDIKAKEKGYQSGIAAEAKEILYHKGFLLRPLGNTVYLLPPYCLTEMQLESSYLAIKETLDEIMDKMNFLS